MRLPTRIIGNSPTSKHHVWQVEINAEEVGIFNNPAFTIPIKILTPVEKKLFYDLLVHHGPQNFTLKNNTYTKGCNLDHFRGNELLHKALDHRTILRCFIYTSLNNTQSLELITGMKDIWAIALQDILCSDSCPRSKALAPDLLVRLQKNDPEVCGELFQTKSQQ